MNNMAKKSTALDTAHCFFGVERRIKNTCYSSELSSFHPSPRPLPLPLKPSVSTNSGLKTEGF